MKALPASGELSPKHQTPPHLVAYLWKKGQSGNPKGKPPGTRSFKTELLHFLATVEQEEGMAFLHHRWKDAFKHRQTAAEMMTYLLPKPTDADARNAEAPTFHVNGPAHVNVLSAKSFHVHPPTRKEAADA